jgi:hypothetical protein
VTASYVKCWPSKNPPQGYLAHQKTPHPWDYRIARSIDLLYRVTSLIRKRPPLWPCVRAMPRAHRGPREGRGRFLMSEVPLLAWEN